MLRFFLILALGVGLSSCITPPKPPELPPVPLNYEDTSKDYLDNTVKADIRSFFDGEVDGYGIMQDENGKIIKTCTAKILGKWDYNKGVVNHRFQYSDGSRDNRTWLITLDRNNITLTAVGHDVLTPAKGKQVGNAIHMSYSLSTKIFGNSLVALPVSKIDGMPQDKGVRTSPDMVLDDHGREVKIEDKMYLINDKSMIMVSHFRSDDGSSGKIIFSFRKIRG